MNKPTILIVDDEAINIKLIAELLTGEYAIKVANNGEKALQVIKQQHPHLILLDIQMPVMGGYEVARELKKNPQTATIPFIFLTSSNQEKDIVKGFSLGAVDYITKPFKHEELLVRVNNHITTQLLQRHLNQALAETKQNLSIIDKYIAFVRTDKDLIIQEVSQRYCDLAQCNKQQLLGQKVSILKSKNTQKDFYQQIWEKLLAEDSFCGEIENKNFKQGTNWYQVTISMDYDSNNNHCGFISFYENIDTRMEIKRLSELDVLTGIYNRKKIDAVLIDEQSRARRYQQFFSVILLDIDHFKAVNDTYGHQAGDQVLIEFCHIIQQHIRQEDIFGRWGGEEFMLICPQTDKEQASQLAEKLRFAIELKDFTAVGKKTVSIGISEYQQDLKLNKLFNQVDEALYMAKNSGRNCVRVYQQ